MVTAFCGRMEMKEAKKIAEEKRREKVEERLARSAISVITNTFFSTVFIIAYCPVLPSTPFMPHFLFILLSPSTSVLPPWYLIPSCPLPLPCLHQMGRQRVKEQIAQDRAALAAKREAEKQGASPQDLKAVEPPAQLPLSKPAQKKEYDTCRLQVSLGFTCSMLGHTGDAVCVCDLVRCCGIIRRFFAGRFGALETRY